MRAVLLTFGGVAAVVAIAAVVAWWWFLRPAIHHRPATTGKLHSHSVEHRGRVRTWQLYTPLRRASSRGLVLVLHGSHQTGAQFREWTASALEVLSDRHGFIVVYADGMEEHWNDCRKVGDYAAKRLQVDDVGFLSHVIDVTVRDQELDPTKIALLGYSNGGHMALRFALERARPLAGIVMFGASVPADDNFICPPGPVNVPAMLVAGTEDPINPYAGGRVVLFGSDRGSVRSVADSARWIAGNDAAASGGIQALASHGLAPDATDQVWRGATGLPVRVLTIRGGGHTVPQPFARFPRFLGKTAQGIDALAEAVSFLGLASARHLKPSSVNAVPG